jgi:hypothetical protein
LIEVIDDVFSFVKDADEVKKIASHGKILVVMAQQTTECAYFIRDYAKKGFCMSTYTLVLCRVMKCISSRETHCGEYLQSDRGYQNSRVPKHVQRS